MLYLGQNNVYFYSGVFKIYMQILLRNFDWDYLYVGDVCIDKWVITFVMCLKGRYYELNVEFYFKLCIN